jgi:hypothetical protein
MKNIINTIKNKAKKLRLLWRHSFTYDTIIKFIFNKGKISTVYMLPCINTSLGLIKAHQIIKCIPKNDLLILFIDDNRRNFVSAFLNISKKNKNVLLLWNPGGAKGLIFAWNTPLKLAKWYVEPKYFMWVSDHDSVNDEYFIEINRLKDKYPEANHWAIISEVEYGDLCFDNKINKQDDVVKINNNNFNYLKNIHGKIIYGLFKTSSCKEKNTFELPNTILPDRLMLNKMYLEGGVSCIKKSINNIKFEDLIIKKTMTQRELINRQLGRLTNNKNKYILMLNAINGKYFNEIVNENNLKQYIEMNQNLMAKIMKYMEKIED